MSKACFLTHCHFADFLPYLSHDLRNYPNRNRTKGGYQCPPTNKHGLITLTFKPCKLGFISWRFFSGWLFQNYLLTSDKVHAKHILVWQTTITSPRTLPSPDPPSFLKHFSQLRVKWSIFTNSEMTDTWESKKNSPCLDLRDHCMAFNKQPQVSVSQR